MLWRWSQKPFHIHSVPFTSINSHFITEYNQVGDNICNSLTTSMSTASLYFLVSHVSGMGVWEVVLHGLSRH